ncbi:MAG: glycoside hydrolase family 9 protein [Paludibacteraceae bacterium]|nr:glycoside hydrolase family 9 protein [Paludibacteraceae bacterium]
MKLTRCMNLRGAVYRGSALAFLGGALFMGNSCSAKEEVKEKSVATSQIGFYPADKKLAIVRNPAAGDSLFEVYNENGKVVYEGKLSEPKYWDASGDTIAWADFSDFKAEGKYSVRVQGVGSHTFSIVSSGVYDQLIQSSYKAFYMWRCGMDIESQYAKFEGIDFSHKAGHPDTHVAVHESAANGNLKEGDFVSSPGGWYDAGDYGKYTTNGAIALTVMLKGYESFPDYYNSLNLDIPESGNKSADVLGECKYELDWLFTMQDTTDGSVAHKVTTLTFAGMVMPDSEGAKAQRYMIGRCTDDALSFAAVMAQAARVYKGDEIYPEMSDKALNAAKKAWNWAMKNPDVIYHQPSDVHTGSYEIHNIDNRWVWAAAELFATTHDESYLDHIKVIDNWKVSTWQDATGYAMMTLLHDAMTCKRESMSEKLSSVLDATVKSYKKRAEEIADSTLSCPGMLGFDKFRWGSNGIASDYGLVLLMAYKHFGDEKYLDLAKQYVNYLTGCNVTDYCFITGFGSKHPVSPHDRRTQSDGIDEPIPGYLVGGPNNEATHDFEAFTKTHKPTKELKQYPTTKYPARTYVDEVYSFSTNEIAINWNAPFAVLLSGIDAVSRPVVTDDTDTKISSVDKK